MKFIRHSTISLYKRHNYSNLVILLYWAIYGFHIYLYNKNGQKTNLAILEITFQNQIISIRTTIPTAIYILFIGQQGQWNDGYEWLFI